MTFIETGYKSSKLGVANPFSLMLRPSTLALSCTGVYGIAQHFSSTMALCHLKLCGCVKAHLIAINKFVCVACNSFLGVDKQHWLAAASHLLQLLCACHFRGSHGSEDTGSEEEKDCSGESSVQRRLDNQVFLCWAQTKSSLCQMLKCQRV